MNNKLDETIAKVYDLEGCLFDLARQRAMAQPAYDDPGPVSDAAYIAGMLLGVRQFLATCYPKEEEYFL